MKDLGKLVQDAEDAKERVRLAEEKRKADLVEKYRQARLAKIPVLVNGFEKALEHLASWSSFANCTT